MQLIAKFFSEGLSGKMKREWKVTRRDANLVAPKQVRLHKWESDLTVGSEWQAGGGREGMRLKLRAQSDQVEEQVAKRSERQEVASQWKALIQDGAILNWVWNQLGV